MADLLLVDNDARITELIGLLLARRGHTVRRAASFAEAREAIVEARPDLLLSDLDLGAEDGQVELPRLSAEGLLPPTLVVSGYLDGPLAERLSELPEVVGLLAKPFELNELEECVRAALRAGAPDAPPPAEAPPKHAHAGDGGWVDVVPLDSAQRPGGNRRAGGNAS